MGENRYGAVGSDNEGLATQITHLDEPSVMESQNNIPNNDLSMVQD